MKSFLIKFSAFESFTSRNFFQVFLPVLLALLLRVNCDPHCMPRVQGRASLPRAFGLRPHLNFVCGFRRCGFFTALGIFAYPLACLLYVMH
uniref:Secreted protein n=1 Tax=Anguilla anguilla TaxID=7936 RepID=A0A0E9WWD6_ANGAN